MTKPTETPVDVKPRSRDVTDGNQKAAARAMLRAVGLTDADWQKPQIGIASSWNEVTPCNASLRRLADSAKKGVRANGGVALEFGTITVSDGISIGPRRYARKLGESRSYYRQRGNRCSCRTL